MHRHDHAQVRVDVLELLAGEAEADVVHARPAPLLGDADPEQRELRHLAQEVALEAVLAVELVDAGRDARAGPVAHRRDQRAVLLAELEVDHEGSSSASSGSAGAAVASSRTRLGRARPGDEHAHARERAHRRERLLPEALVDDLDLETGLAQAERRQLGLVHLVGLQDDVPLTVRGTPRLAHRSFQAGLRFSITERRPSSTSCVWRSWFR